MRYVLKVAYDGSNYCGWQIQSNEHTVQEELEKSLSQIFGTKIKVTASGRTDSDVHALCQICHFDAETTIPPEKLANVLNIYLNYDIGILASAIAPDDFDANRWAKKKTYRYSVYFSDKRNPILGRDSMQIRGECNMEKIAECGKLFEGKHNFKAYCASGSQVKTFEREIYSVKVESGRDGRVDIYVTGNGFLYNMVRTMVGTMIDYSQGARTREQVLKSLETGDRSLVGKTLHAYGLTLMDVDYGFELFK